MQQKKDHTIEKSPPQRVKVIIPAWMSVSVILLALLISATLAANVAGLLGNRKTTEDGSMSAGAGSFTTLDNFQDFITGNFQITQDRASIDITKIRQGCIGGKDCLVSIDEPQFESVQEANAWLSDNDLVFGISINGDVRSYPQRILNRHEIVNDVVGGTPVLVTFCPLCGTAIAFERTVNGNIVTFGVSGKLVNSNLVMYNRADNSLWQQQGGEQIVGDHPGTKLPKVPLTTTTWGQWKFSHPDTKSLTRPSGDSSLYDIYPYGNYESSRELGFGVVHTDARLHEKAIIYGVVINDQAAAYSQDGLIRDGIFSDTVGGAPITITRKTTGEVSVMREDTGEEIIPERGFWFSWAAFYPETKLDGE